MTAFRRRLLALVLLLLPLVATGCFEIGEVAVENNTDLDIVLWRFQVDCDPLESEVDVESSKVTLRPGERQSIPLIKSDLFDAPSCIAAVERSGLYSHPPVTYPVERGTLYVVVQQANSLRVIPAGPHEEEFTFDFHVSTTVLLIFGAPFALSALAALWITVKFFVDFGKRPYMGVS